MSFVLGANNPQDVRALREAVQARRNSTAQKNTEHR
mgnify:CR=1 FL=1